MKEHELKADKERKEKLDMIRVHGCSLCKRVTGGTLRRYNKGYICTTCMDKKMKGIPIRPVQEITISPVEQATVRMERWKYE